MTVSDLLDQVVFDSGDSGSHYRAAARRWLNLTRAYIAARGFWRVALDPDVELTTAAATTSGIYAINSSYDFIASDNMYDETNTNTVRHESLGALEQIDPVKDTTGPPTWWGDAGTNTSGVRQIYLWPVPSGTYTIRYPAYRLLTDLTDADDQETVDPFFGPIITWADTFTEGLRFFHDQNNNEDATQLALQRRAFEESIKVKKKKNRLSVTAKQELALTNAQRLIGTGRFDPGHFDNR